MCHPLCCLLGPNLNKEPRDGLAYYPELDLCHTILNLTYGQLTLWPVGELFIQCFLSYITESLIKADSLLFFHYVIPHI